MRHFHASLPLAATLTLSALVFTVTPVTSAAAQSTTPPSASSSSATPKAPSKPDYKNLRFDEIWVRSMRTSHWDDLIKAIPIVLGQPVTLTFGGQLRWRGESYRDFNTTTQNDENTQTRLQLLADLQVGIRERWHGRIFAEARDAQSYGRNLPGGARSNDADRHDMQNLFADLAFGASFVRYGRQEIAINRERLFGVPDWSNTRRGLQGARALLTRGAFALEGMDTRPVIVRQSQPNRADSTTRFRTLSFGSATGAAPLATGMPAIWQGYWYEQEVRTPTTLTRRLTTGGRAQWQLGSAASPHGYSFEVEGGSQHGHVSARSADAWFWVAEGQLTWRTLFGAPTIAIGIEEASGENAATSARAEAFFTLYPAAHAHGGYADVIGRANARELHAISTWDPTKALQLRGALYRFDRVRTDDGIYTKQNTIFRAASGSTDRHAADELDLTGIWKATRHVRVTFGGGIVSPGAFLKNTPGGAHTEHWGFAGTSFTF